MDRLDQSQIDALVAAYERDGFVNGGRVLGEAELAALDADWDKVAESVARGEAAAEGAPPVTQWGANHFQVQSVRHASPAFEAAARSEPMLALAAALARTKLIQLWSDTVHYKAPLTGGIVDWHQDGAYYWGVTPARRTISAWIALDDADEETGCMWMAPGSQRWGDKEKYLRRLRKVDTPPAFDAITPPDNVRDQWRGIQACPVKRGEVHFHHPHTWHGSPPNRSSRRRRGYSLFLLTGDVRAEEKNGFGLAAGEPMRRASAHAPILFQAKASPNG